MSRAEVKNAAHVRYSVRENSTSRRTLDINASNPISKAKFRIVCRVPTASPPRWRSAKPAIMRVFYSGTDNVLRTSLCLHLAIRFSQSPAHPCSNACVASAIALL